MGIGGQAGFKDKSSGRILDIDIGIGIDMGIGIGIDIDMEDATDDGRIPIT